MMMSSYVLALVQDYTNMATVKHKLWQLLTNLLDNTVQSNTLKFKYDAAILFV